MSNFPKLKFDQISKFLPKFVFLGENMISPHNSNFRKMGIRAYGAMYVHETNSDTLKEHFEWIRMLPAGFPATL